MYENLNKNSIIGVAKALINGVNSQATPEQQLELFVECIVIPFFICIGIGLMFLKMREKINIMNITRVAIMSLWFTLSFLWVVITILIDTSLIVTLAPEIPIIIIEAIKKLIMLWKKLKQQQDKVKT